MEFAIDRFNDSVKFALEHISKASLQLSPHQMNALQSILSGKDTFVCLPTGQGKSILFECFPHCYDFLHSCKSEQSQPSSVLVISPLISLMNSQVHDVRKRNQSTLRLSVDASTDEQSQLMCGKISYVFSAPEVLDEEQ